MVFISRPARMPGSPPPMRGKECHRIRKKILTGITPAHAGKRDDTEAMRQGREDHPRPCGEKKRGERRSKQPIGSPPPMRGKDTYMMMVNEKLRINPAHAGKRAEIIRRIVAT